MRKKQLNNIKKIVVFTAIFLITVILIAVLLKEKNNNKNSFSDNFYSLKYPVHGVDLSHHNPIIDWKTTSHNISFIYLKATEGTTHEDRNYKYNYKQAKDNNIKTGTYHFYAFGVSGKEQAEFFIKKSSFEPGDLIPAIDVEHSSHNAYSKDTGFIALVINELKILENKIYEHIGLHPIIYTNSECYRIYIKNNFPDNPIWLCSLKEEPNETEIPNWVIWQFSHKGRIDGVDENIDLNYFRYPFEDLYKYLLP